MYTCIELSFGKSCRDGKLLPRRRVAAVEYLTRLALSQYLPGAQIYHITGDYRSIAGNLISEDCTIIKAFTTQKLEDLWPQLLILACEVAAALDQEAVLLRAELINGKLASVKPIFKSPLQLSPEQPTEHELPLPKTAIMVKASTKYTLWSLVVWAALLTSGLFKTLITKTRNGRSIT